MRDSSSVPVSSFRHRQSNQSTQQTNKQANKQLLRTFDAPDGLEEGWGLTASADGKYLVIGDGSNAIYFVTVPPPLAPGAPQNTKAGRLVVSRVVYVHDCLNGITQVKGLNELELVPRALTNSIGAMATAANRGVGQVPWQHHQNIAHEEMGNTDTHHDDMIWVRTSLV
jgi:hypothetical protein